MPHVVLDRGSTKQAALFFDHVIPIDGVEGLSGLGLAPRLSGNADIEGAQRIILELLPPDFGTQDQLAKFASAAAIGVMNIQVGIGFFNCDEATQKGKEFFADLDAPSGWNTYPSPLPITIPAEYASSEVDQSNQPDSRAVLSLSDILIPDVKNISWDAILEFRKDSEARHRLRRLRTFAEQEYAGKSKAYVEDDLSVRLADYEQAMKKWGIKGVLGVLSTCFTLEATLQAGAAHIIAVMSGVPSEQAFGASLLLPVGRAVIEATTASITRNDAIRNHPLAYVSEVKRM